MKIALAQYPVTRFASFRDWRAHAAAWVADAAGQGAQLLSFPEYGGMELAGLLPEALQGELRGQLAAMAQFQDDFVAVHGELASKHGVFIQAPTLPVRVEDMVHNRAWLFAPSGRAEFQDKRLMTRFETEEWGITGGAALKVFDLGAARIAIATCYDIEFPLIAHALAQAGADLILAPSCTDTLAGANRVHVGARARALENQVYVAVAPLVGNASWSPAVDVNMGWAALYAMPDRGLPDDGILAAGTLNRPGWIVAEADFARLRAARGTAQVFNRRDWAAQARPGLDVAVLALS